LFGQAKGSHQIYRHKKSGIIVPVPLHNKTTASLSWGGFNFPFIRL